MAIGLMLAIGAVSISVSQDLYLKNDLEIATISLSQTIREAQMMAKEGYRDSRWGVKVQQEELTLYKGTSYDSRDTTFDEKITIPKGVEITGVDDFNFSKLEGEPQTSGNISLKISSYENNISVNEKGILSY